MTNTVSNHLKIGLLGPFYVCVDGQEISPKVWTSKKALTLLKYLAARPGQRVSSDELIDLLWADNGNVDSIRLLYTAVWFARDKISREESALSTSPMRYSDGAYWLELSEENLDTALFEKHEKASRRLEKEDPETALHHCLEALQLYRGDFLCDDIYEEWTNPYRVEYQELFLQISLRAANLLIEYHNDYKQALQICRNAINKDPFREEIYQAGIEALILDQRYPEAMKLYRKYCQMLEDEFQLEPSRKIQALIAGMRRKADDRTATPVSSHGSPLGALPCDRAALQSIYASELRRLSRTNSNFSILIVTCSEIMQNTPSVSMIRDTLQQSLRHSDTICHYAPDMIVVFLPDTDLPGSRVLMRRLEQILITKFGDITGVAFEVLNSENLQQMQEKWETLIG